MGCPLHPGMFLRMLEFSHDRPVVPFHPRDPDDEPNAHHRLSPRSLATTGPTACGLPRGERGGPVAGCHGASASTVVRYRHPRAGTAPPGGPPLPRLTRGRVGPPPRLTRPRRRGRGPIQAAPNPSTPPWRATSAPGREASICFSRPGDRNTPRCPSRHPLCMSWSSGRGSASRMWVRCPTLRGR